MLSRVTRFSSLLALPLCALLWSSPAQAQRGVAKGKPTVAGAKVNAWKAKGVTFRSETIKRGKNGPTLHWRRSAKKADGTTSFVGKTWGTPFSGVEQTKKGVTTRNETQTLKDGSTRTIDTTISKSGTTRKTITGLPGVAARKITQWTAGNAKMTVIVDRDAAGKVISVKRSGSK